MAQFGAKRPRFAPVATTPDNALPTYNFESVVTIGKLVAANLTVTNASGELYGDDALAEKIDTEVAAGRESREIYRPRPRDIRFHLQPREALTESLYVLFFLAAIQRGADGIPARQDGKPHLHRPETGGPGRGAQYTAPPGALRERTGLL